LVTHPIPHQPKSAIARTRIPCEQLSSSTQAGIEGVLTAMKNTSSKLNSENSIGIRQAAPFMTASIIRLFTTLILVFSLSACALSPTYHKLVYQKSDNPDIDLLEWEYSNRRHVYINSPSTGFSQISYGSGILGKELKIKWRDNFTQKTHQTEIPLIKNLPFNMQNSEIRLTFNKINQPEVYVIHEAPGSIKHFSFKTRIYTRKLVRQIYPINQYINIKGE